ncbi:MAG: hypothetical protein IPF54_21680 [Draconibacterium sp.]|nr:hypothetical protein [Draconibacterium sp.]
MADDWGSRARRNAGNPYNLEIRIQAYEAIANGAPHCTGSTWEEKQW